MLDLANIIIKAIIINILKELKEILFKELKENMMTMTQQIIKFHEEIHIIKNNQNLNLRVDTNKK